MKNEAEIGAGVVAWLEDQHWDVYQEVKYYGGIADIVAVNGNLVWVIECKRSLTLHVMDQARGWRTHFRSVAVPRPKRFRERFTAYGVAKNYFKVGVLEVSRTEFRGEVGYSVEVKVPAPLMREHHKFAKMLIEKGLVPEQKVMAKAGTKGGNYSTPYKRTMTAVRRFIEKNPGCTIKEIMDDLGKMHYASDASARSTIPRSLQTIESEWCRVDRDSRPFRFYIKES